MVLKYDLIVCSRVASCMRPMVNPEMVGTVSFFDGFVLLKAS